MKAFLSALVALLIVTNVNADIVQKPGIEEWTDVFTPWNHRIFTDKQDFRIKVVVNEEKESVSFQLCHEVTGSCKSLGPYSEITKGQLEQAVHLKSSQTSSVVKGLLGGYVVAAAGGFMICAIKVRGSDALACFGFLIPFHKTFLTINLAGAVAGGWYGYEVSDPSNQEEMEAVEVRGDIEVSDVLATAEKINGELYEFFNLLEQRRLEYEAQQLYKEMQKEEGFY